MTNNTLSALAGLSPDGPKFDLIGPTVDDDVRRIVARYGAEPVKEAVKRQTTAKRGRPRIKDWPELREVIEADARDWLNGGDPFAARSSYSIAKTFADSNPGQSHPATMKRIIRKLDQRRWQTMAAAMQISSDDYPYSAHIRALEALEALDTHPIWRKILADAQMHVAEYTAKKGELPAAHLTIKEVEVGARSSLANLVALGRPYLGSAFMSDLDNSTTADDTAQ